MQFLHRFSINSPTLTSVKNLFCFSNPNRVEIQTWAYPVNFIVAQPLIPKKDPKYSRYTHITSVNRCVMKSQSKLLTLCFLPQILFMHGKALTSSNVFLKWLHVSAIYICLYWSLQRHATLVTIDHFAYDVHNKVTYPIRA